LIPTGYTHLNLFKSQHLTVKSFWSSNQLQSPIFHGQLLVFFNGQTVKSTLILQLLGVETTLEATAPYTFCWRSSRVFLRASSREPHRRRGLTGKNDAQNIWLVVWNIFYFP
jgi:hypothetical protein